MTLHVEDRPVKDRSITMKIYFDDADPVAECMCRWHTHGDSLSDAVLAWAKHVTEKHQDDW